MRKRPTTITAFCAITAAMLLSVCSLQAGELRFSRHLGDGMVLQRDQPVTISGFADKGVAVTVELAGETQQAKADDTGLWRVTFTALPASSKGQTVSAKAAGSKVVLSDVVIGDVFLFARQTSVDVSLGSKDTGKRPAEKSPFRAISIKTIPAAKPLTDLAADAT